MKNYNFGTSQYYKATPKKIKLIGKGMLVVSGIVAVFAPGAKWAIAIGILGDYLASNFSNKE